MPKNFVKFVSHATKVAEAHRRIGLNAVKAAAQVVVNQAKMNARGGFKSGDFVTTGWNTINYEVIDGPPIRANVGSPLKHFMWWELGHHNIFTRGYERYEWLKPAFQTTTAEQQTAAAMAAKMTAVRYGLPGLGTILG